MRVSQSPERSYGVSQSPDTLYGVSQSPVTSYGVGERHIGPGIVRNCYGVGHSPENPYEVGHCRGTSDGSIILLVGDEKESMITYALNFPKTFVMCAGWVCGTSCPQTALFRKSPCQW